MRSKLKVKIENAVKLRVVDIGRNPLTRRPWVDVEYETAFGDGPRARRMLVGSALHLSTTIENSVGAPE